jgi:hypothetical protein
MSQAKLDWKIGLGFLAALFLLGMACSLFDRQVGNITGRATQPAATVTQPLETEVLPTNTRTAYTVIQASAELLASIAASEWTASGGYTSSLPSVSPDYQAGEAFVLSAAEIQVPPSCQARSVPTSPGSNCRNAVAVQLSNQLPAITCLQTEQVLWGEYCAQVSIPAGAAFRFRGVLLDTHPAQWNYIPVLELLPPSDAPCLEGEFRCAVDQTCFAGFDGYCRSCLGLEKERCACQSPQGDLPDGSACQYWLSGDVLMSGKCQAGVCK